MNEIERILLSVLVQLSVIIAAARIGALALRRLGQPQVVGEIMAGLVLGPSVLGALSPGAFAALFDPSTTLIFRVLSELGLMLLMFLIGMEFDFSHLKTVGRTAVGVAVAGIAVPFAVGWGLSLWMHPLIASDVNSTGFGLIIAVAFSITAIPILGRIMIELKIQRSRLGALVISAAAIDDAVGWTLLAAVSAVIHGAFSMASVMAMVGYTIVFVAACFWIVRPLLHRFGHHLLGAANELQPIGLTVVLIIIFIAAITTNVIGLFSIFGPFVVGAVLSGQTRLCEAIRNRLQDFVYAFFLPIFFTFTGMRTDVGALQSVLEWSIFAVVIAGAILGKTVACGFAARLGGLNWRECGSVAVLMNTRALMGLIAINLGMDLGVIPKSVFTMLVLMAIITTLMATPIVRRLIQPSSPELSERD